MKDNSILDKISNRMKAKTSFNVQRSNLTECGDRSLSKFNISSSKKQEFEMNTASPRNDMILFSDSGDNTIQQIIQEDAKGNLEQNLENLKAPYSPKYEQSDAILSQKNILIDQQSPIINSAQHQRNKRKALFKTQKSIKLIVNMQNSNKQQKRSISVTSERNTFMNLKLIAQLKVKMIYFYKKFTSSGRRLLLEQNKKIRQTLNDKSDFGQLVGNKLIQQIFSLKNLDLENTMREEGDRFMIKPNSYLNLIFLIIFSTVNTIFFLLLSIMMIFYGPADYEYFINKTIIVFWAFQILIQLNTQIYEQTILINKRKILFLLYIRDKVFFDLIPIILISIQPDQFVLHKIFQLIAFIKLNNVMIDINLLQKYLCMSVKNYYIIQLLNLIVKLFILGHIIACMWYLIGQFELKILGSETTWYDKSMGNDYVWWKLYLESMYWALTLMTTGSNVGSSLIQLFFTTFIMLFTTIIFGYMLNTTGIILSQLNQQDENKRIDLNILNDYMRANKISKNLQGRVNEDLEYYYLNNLNKEQEENQQVLKKISPHLNKLLKLEYCRQFLEKMPFFEKKFSKETVDEICLELQEEYYSPNQWIFKENQCNDLSLMCIVQGSAELVKSFSGEFNQKEQKVVTRFSKGQLLGQINFFTGFAYHHSAKTREFTKIVRISRDKFLEIISKRQKDCEVFCSIKDKQAIYEEYGVTEFKCFFCNCYTHLANDCHLVHVQRSQFLQKAKIYAGKTQNRQSHERKNIYSNSYFVRKEIERQILKFKWNHKRNQKIEKIQIQKQIYKVNDDSQADSEFSDYMSVSQQYISSNFSSENQSEDSEVLPVQLKNQPYFENGKSIQGIQRAQQLNQFRKKRGSLDQIQQSNIQQQQNPPKLNFINSNTSLQNIGMIEQTPNKDQSKFRYGWIIQDEENIHTTKLSIPSTNFVKNFKESQFGSQLNIGNDKKRMSKQYQNPRKSQYKQKSQVFLDQKQVTQENDKQKHKQKPQHLNEQTQNPVTHLNNQLNEEKEKRKLQNLLEFDVLKEWSFYFPQGNYKNIIAKYYRYIRKKKIKAATQCYLKN